MRTIATAVVGLLAAALTAEYGTNPHRGGAGETVGCAAASVVVSVAALLGDLA